VTEQGRGQHLEEEIKLEAETDAVLPDLSDLPGVFEIRAAPPDELDAVYFDTAELRLIRAGITLRRRAGGTDEGWHLKFPAPFTASGGYGAGTARLEVHRPFGRRAGVVPPSLLALVRSRLRGEAVSPVARIRTHRTRYDVIGADGAKLAEVADDVVTAEAYPPPPVAAPHAAEGAAEERAQPAEEPAEERAQPGEGAAGEGAQPAQTASDSEPRLQRWREIEVELAGGDRELLDSARTVLLATVARPAPSPSKLARTLHDRLLGDEGRARVHDHGEALPPRDGDEELRPRDHARLPAPGGPAQVALERIGAEYDRLVELDPQVRLNAVDAIHQMRVTARRLRSQLATFRPLFRRAPVERLRGELAWLGSALSPARDAEVMHAQLLAELSDEPAHLIVGPVRRRVDRELKQEYRVAHISVVQALNSPRQLTLLEDLNSFLLDPPLAEPGPAEEQPPATGKVHKRLVAELTPLVAGSYRRLEKAVGRVGGARSTAEREVRWHEVRKAAKRSRYAAEAVADTVGEPATAFAEAAEQVQEILGARQDETVVAAMLLSLARRATAAGENAFTYGRLHARLEQRAAGNEEQVRDALASLTELAGTWPG
jgi:CHAD domain-containing protein